MKAFIIRALAIVVVAALAAALPVSALAEAVRAADAPARGEIWDNSITEGFAGGTGTEEDPYLISNGAELAYLARQVNSGTSYEGSCFELTADIYLNDTADWESWGSDTAPTNAWTQIGAISSPFSGSFDGCGYAVYGVYIDEPDADFQGLFGYVEDSAIANLGVSESYICGYEGVGGVVGYNDHGEIIGCYNTGSVTGDSKVGGVAGGNTGGEYGIVANCCNAGSVNGADYVGGVVGWNHGTVANCRSMGSAAGNYDVGGVVGDNIGGELGGCVTGCYNTGSVTGAIFVGGVLGVNDGTVANCYNTGSIIGGLCVGGVLGMNSVDMEIDMCAGAVANCYNTGSVTGNDYVGGAAGDNEGTLSNCYYLDSCCESGDGFGAALTDEQMREASSFIGFDFAEVWTMEGNASYPYPELISNPHGGASESVPGDLNNDGAVTPEDALLVLRMALNLDALDPNGDVNGDGAVTPDDALVILRWALGL